MCVCICYWPCVYPTSLEVCGKCGEALSRTQPAVRAMDKLFHSNCFCCMTCHRPLQGMQFYDRDGSPQCEDCYMVRHTHMRQQLQHHNNHPPVCFQVIMLFHICISPCLCSYSEFTGGLLSLWGEDHRPSAESGRPVFPCPLFPVQHLLLQPGGGALHHWWQQQPLLCPGLPQVASDSCVSVWLRVWLKCNLNGQLSSLHSRRFSPLCVSCNEPIVPAPGSEETVRVVALDKNFHLKCYRCEVRHLWKINSQ